MKESYDVIVAGAGPGGSRAALAAAAGGASVLMLEKDREVGVPVRCAEGVSAAGLELVTEKIDEKWIAQEITGARFTAPDGTVIDAYPDDKGYILHRKLFDYDLAAEAAVAGAVIKTRACVKGLLRDGDMVTGVRYEHLGRECTAACRIVIAADGTESRVGRWAGLDTSLPPAQMESCVQMTLAGISIDPGRIEFHVGGKVAPGGYAWVFPKSERTANVGLGITGDFSRTRKPLSYLQEFAARRFPGASVLTLVAGGVPVGPPLKKISGDGIMLVGDAARQANALTGGGIVNAMLAGQIAGRIAAEAARTGNTGRSFLAAYDKEWYRQEGKNCLLSYKIKQVVDRFSDDDLNATARLLEKIPPERRGAFQIFKAALINHPRLILQAAKVFV